MARKHAHRARSTGKRRPHYTLLDEMLASPTQPLPQAQRVHHLSLMWEGLRALETSPQANTDDWRVCSDCVNLLETFTTHNGGHWLGFDGDLVHITDQSGLLMDAITALAMAGKRHKAGQPLRLDGPGIQAVRAALEDYAALLDALPHRTVVKAHRLTEQRLAAILAGHVAPHEVEVIDL
jgi:hypothetical protein